MSNHVNIENDEVTIPYYAIHNDGKIFGFFGPFRFLSNFYIPKNGVVFEDLMYPSVEHGYQAAKWPHYQREQFVDISAGQAKKLGKLAPKFDAKKWNKKKYDIMSALIYQKFSNNPDLKEMLLLTDGYILEERNSWGDQDWGTNEQGVGENNLGRILMNIRDGFKMENKNELF
jgi:ribA/ribD-fused uncharacterized protein